MSPRSISVLSGGEQQFANQFSIMKHQNRREEEEEEKNSERQRAQSISQYVNRCRFCCEKSIRLFMTMQRCTFEMISNRISGDIDSELSRVKFDAVTFSLWNNTFGLFRKIMGARARSLQRTKAHDSIYKWYRGQRKN